MIYFFKKLQKKACLKIFLFISYGLYSQLVFANLQPPLKNNHQQNIVNNYIHDNFKLITLDIFIRN